VDYLPYVDQVAVKILVTGANGFIGRQILIHLAETVREGSAMEIIAASAHGDAYPSAGYSFHKVDQTDSRCLRNALDLLKPDVIINTAAISIMSACESDPEYAFKLNAVSVEEMSRWCASNGARIVQISTDTVFSSDTGYFHKEEDPPSPPNVYGRTKAEAERAIISLCDNYAILRVVLVYGRPLPGQHGNIVKLVMDKLSDGQPVNIVDDQWRTPTYVGDVARMAERAALVRESGVWHICSRECLSIYEMALRTASVCKLDSSLIKPVHTDVSETGFMRPKYGLLDISKAERDFGFDPVSLEEGISLLWSNKNTIS